MTDIQFYSPAEVDDSTLQFVVIAARYCNQWVFSRHKQRGTWDIPGGHREEGESIGDAARRELWEETGAERAELSQVAVYSVTKNGITRNGMLYFANILDMGQLPDVFEMAEILCSDKVPCELTYPDIYPALFLKVQGWLNTQSNAGELWDVYDENRNLTGKLHRRGDPLKKGEYHLVVHVWMLNSEGRFLLTKRSPNKGFPNMWESTGGSALAGDDSLTAALREVKEETGLNLDIHKGKLLFSAQKADYFRDVWLFCQDFDLEAVVLQREETTDKMYADKETILSMQHSDEFVPYDYVEELFRAAGL